MLRLLNLKLALETKSQLIWWRKNLCRMFQNKRKSERRFLVLLQYMVCTHPRLEAVSPLWIYDSGDAQVVRGFQEPFQDFAVLLLHHFIVTCTLFKVKWTNQKMQSAKLKCNNVYCSLFFFWTDYLLHLSTTYLNFTPTCSSPTWK